MLSKDYMTADDLQQGLLYGLTVDKSWKQSFEHEFATGYTHNDSFVIRWYCDLEAEDRAIIKEIAVFLAKFKFATEEHISKMLRIKGYPSDSCDKFIPLLMEKKFINCFTFSCTVFATYPEDAARIYCLDLCGMYILHHFHQAEYLVWKKSDVYYGYDLVMKFLSTTVFYISLLEVKGENLKSFDPCFDILLKNRMTRFSASFYANNGKAEHPFLLESIRRSDMPEYYRKKLREQVTSFMGTYTWAHHFSEPPAFVLLVESEDMIREVADTFAHVVEDVNFVVVTNADVARDMVKARFFYYDLPKDENGRPAVEGTLSSRDAKILSRKTSI